MSNLALAYQQLGQVPEAKDAIATSLALLAAEPDHRDRQNILPQALNTQGSLQMSWGQAEAALNSLQQAEAAYEQVGDQAGVFRSLLNQAQTLRVMGLYRRSLNILNQVNHTLEEQPYSPLKAAGMRQTLKIPVFLKNLPCLLSLLVLLVLYTGAYAIRPYGLYCMM
ncbi:MAG: hypothetical protein F6K47_22405 [Symploca sp. SIO2E6]|nr:hypothetical protein [Symploca sp. SIO2E6]